MPSFEVADPTAARAALPPTAIGPITEPFDGVLLWLHSGSATVEAAGARHELAAGEAIWIPPGVEHRAEAEADAVLFPYLVAPARWGSGWAHVRVVVIPRSWEAWMIYRWDDNTLTADETPGAGDLRTELERLTPPDPSPAASLSPPPLPRSPEALEVARAVLRQPASARGIDGWAALHNVSGRTLQRQFVRDTGLSFSTWRARARASAAARRLDAGEGAEAVGRSVGYRTPSGFSRAFRRQAGVTPRARARAAGGRAGRVAGGPENRDRVSPVVSAASVPPPPVPMRSFWTAVADHHELLWVYRGEVRLRIGPRRWVMRQGQAIWVPAGLPHAIDFTAGALMLTVGIAHGRVATRVGDLEIISVPSHAERLLLHTMVGEHTSLRPDTGHGAGNGAFVNAMFRAQFAPGRAGAEGADGALGEIALVLRRDPADRRGLADWAAHLCVGSAALGREFVTQAGESFPRWRAKVRMDVARELLRAGSPPGEVARALGYAGAPAFSGAFATAHGLSPRDYARREAGRD
ncbi:helix-turn-helix domain-containing protein [Microbacterium sp. VKM Ac-2923]|uniref:helix-turn-helix domain-containing protein n=1 Tax=Microbacterium sp. VKM Ac-2923 TaxID=2929476 RepID=UPI001FB23945|nr:helix-turn-helix domain-containing protein [Microbacterium sp. VKM Ac-2923]MCJ1708507.1 helix-turn-helix domain-containing protein [Microbacterium sp. VKM Ac-2923]